MMIKSGTTTAQHVHCQMSTSRLIIYNIIIGTHNMGHPWVAYAMRRLQWYLDKTLNYDIRLGFWTEYHNIYTDTCLTLWLNWKISDWLTIIYAYVMRFCFENMLSAHDIRHLRKSHVWHIHVNVFDAWSCSMLNETSCTSLSSRPARKRRRSTSKTLRRSGRMSQSARSTNPDPTEREPRYTFIKCSLAKQAVSSSYFESTRLLLVSTTLG